jgi:hypothetical protein
LEDAGVVVERLEGDAEGRLWITVPDGTEEPDVAIVVERHTPRREYDAAALSAGRAPGLRDNRRRGDLTRLRGAVGRAETVDDLKGALAGVLDLVEKEAEA